MTYFDLQDWTPADFADPYPRYRAFREQGPVHRGTDGAWWVFDHRTTREVLLSRDFGHGTDRPKVPGCPAINRTVNDWPVFMNPPRHTAIRKLISPPFLPKAVTDRRPRIRQIAEEMAAKLAAQPDFDLVTEFAVPFPVRVVAELLGTPAEEGAWLSERLTGLREIARMPTAGMPVPPDYPRAEQAAVELAEFVGELIVARRRRPRTDLISALTREREWSDEELAHTCVSVLIAAHDSAATLIAKAVLALHRFPRLRQRLREEPTLMPEAVEEIARYDSPVQLISRAALRDTELAGHRIRRDEVVVLLLGAANRDPGEFDAPDEPRLGRPANPHLAFSVGLHFCLGAHLARAQAAIGLHALLTALPRMRVLEDTVEYGNYLAFHGPLHVQVRTADQGDPA
ncbi:cytochrome P450 [Pseudonocardia eucalypti]|uniref:Cytochrome P450 n=1 Tax=Pseudonocardia eucalypti TaxID=648755 RepID=A0ABP9QCR1_9PSEU|nr:cytochrome P450 [Pseudonocardia eucalypti]